MSANPALATTSLIPLDLIDESPSNPRKDFGDLAELAASIKEKGVLQNIVVRPIGDRFEVVFGHRRLRASRLAGLDAIPAQVRALDDVQVLEEQLIENAQRKDVHPLEEADAYKRLAAAPPEGFGLTGEEIAQRVGKHKATVFARMKLASLVDPELRAACLSGELPVSTALLLARVPAEIQTKAKEAILFGGIDGDEQGTAMTVRQAARYLFEEHFIGIDQDHIHTKGEKAGQEGGPDDGALANFEVMTKAKEKWEAKEADAKKKREQADADYKKRATEEKKKAKAEKKAEAKKPEVIREEIVKEEKGKAALSIRKEILSKIEAKPDHDAKLLRLFLAMFVTRWMIQHEDVDGIKLPANIDKMSKSDELAWKLEAFSKLKADKIREIALKEIIEHEYALGEDGIAFRPDESIPLLTPIARLFGVDLVDLDKKYQASVTKRLADAGVQTSAPKGEESKPIAKSTKDALKKVTAGPKKTLAKTKKAPKK